MTTGESSIDIPWQPGIGDPTPAGWVSVFAYFATALMCWMAARTSQSHAAPGDGSAKMDARFWSIVAIFMVFLGFNKQIDLQTLFTQVGKYLAHSGGWYDQRQTFQILFILGLSCAAIMIIFSLLWMFRRCATEIKIATIGLCSLLAFIVMRAASFHHIDMFLGEQIMGFRWNTLLELGSILCILAAGFSYRTNRYKQP